MCGTVEKSLSQYMYPRGARLPITLSLKDASTRADGVLPFLESEAPGRHRSPPGPGGPGACLSCVPMNSSAPLPDHVTVREHACPHLSSGGSGHACAWVGADALAVDLSICAVSVPMPHPLQASCETSNVMIKQSTGGTAHSRTFAAPCGVRSRPRHHQAWAICGTCCL